MLPDDPRRCDFVERVESESANDTDSDSGSATDTSGIHNSSESVASDHASVASVHAGVPLIRAAIAPTPLHELARRECFDHARALNMRTGYCIESVDMELAAGARNFVPIQDTWDDMLRTCADRYSDVFWKFFLQLHKMSQVAVDGALTQVRLLPFFPNELRGRFPKTRRAMMRNLGCIPAFWRIVQHTHRIDVSHFDLPSGTRFLDFEFIDPIWGWLIAARRHDPADLHWIPLAQNRTHAPVYGGGYSTEIF